MRTLDRALFDCLPDIALLLSPDGQRVQLNLMASQKLGWTADEALPLGQVVTACDAVAVRRSLSGVEPVEYEVSLLDATGQTVPVEVRQQPVRFGGGQAYLALARDLRRRRQAAMILDTRYRIVAENTSDWEFWLSPHGHFFYCSPSCREVTGREAWEFESDPDLIFGLVHPADSTRFSELWITSMREQLGPVAFEFRIQRADGQTRWMEHSSRPVFDSQGNFLGFRGSHRDVTEQRRAQQERDRLAAVVEHSPESILITDGSGTILYVNRSFTAQTGWPRHEAVGRQVDLLLRDDPAALRAVLDAVKEGADWSGSYLKTRKDGSTLHIDATVKSLGVEQGTFVWGERDVTQQRRLEQQLRHSQKMEAIGTLAGGIAHDFNNILSGILGYASLLKLNAGPSGETYEAADVIEKAARRAAELTRQLLGFARGGKHQHVPVSVRRAAESVLQLLCRTIDPTVRLETDFCEGDPRIMGDPAQVELVLLNLMINARDAIGEGPGTIWVSTRVTGERLVLAVRDTGCGIAPADVARIFEPFFTTKEKGQGTGMGLAMVYGIVQNHGGSIRVDSAPGRGSTFIVEFPCAAAEVPESDPAVDSRPCSGHGVILVVDDDELVRRMLGSLLRRLGYQVVFAADGQEACSYYAEHRERVDLVVLDMMMPAMSGPECFRGLRAINPEVRVILSTGYCLNDRAQELLDMGAVDFIQKPYQLDELSATVARALAG
ncbi:MAG: PAS domain S-box protein [Candidatus Eremiobacterota bacterium]